MRTALAIAAVVLALWGMTRLMEGRLSYFPMRELVADPGVVGLRFTDVFFSAADGVRLHGWYCPPPEGIVHRAEVIFFHGNAGNVSHRLTKIRALAGLGLGVFIFDYRGFGRSGGSPDDAGVLKDAAAAFVEFRKRTAAGGRPRGIYGESIGCLPAVRQAAASGDAAFLVLEGSFPGKRAVVAGTPLLWPWYPFVSATLDMQAHAPRVNQPVLVLHARGDEVIPVALGRSVHGLLSASAMREWYEVPRGGHNDCFEADGSFFPRIGAFLDRALSLTSSAGSAYGFPEGRLTSTVPPGNTTGAGETGRGTSWISSTRSRTV